MKNGIREIVRLSFITALLIVSAGVAHVVDFCTSGVDMHEVANVLYLCYVTTNPFVYLFVMKDLRREYGKQLCGRRQRVDPHVVHIQKIA